jgi:hydroxymethylbilane synthase
MLARWQAEWVAQRLQLLGADTQLVEVSTVGDRRDTQRIANLGTQGVFTKEIQHALLENRADIAVHSYKDLPTEVTEGVVVAAVAERGDPADALVTHEAHSLDELPEAARVGTSSVRRRAQLLRIRPDLRIVDMRGNVDTRLAKLDSGQVQALVLAASGLRRLGYAARIAQRFDPRRFVCAVGQGALAIECRESDATSRALLAALDHAPTRLATGVERTLLGELRAGCLAPVGAYARSEGRSLMLWAVVLSEDGRSRLSFEGAALLAEGRKLALQAAKTLLHDGAQRLIAASRA